MTEGLSAQKAEPQAVMIGATSPEVHCTASSLGVKKDLRRLIGRAKGCMNKKLHAVTAANDCPLNFVIMASQVSECNGAAALLSD